MKLNANALCSEIIKLEEEKIAFVYELRRVLNSQTKSATIS